MTVSVVFCGSSSRCRGLICSIQVIEVFPDHTHLLFFLASGDLSRLHINFANSSDPDQGRQNTESVLD